MHAHTQNIESTWMKFKKRIKKSHGLTRLERDQIFVYYESRLVTDIILKKEKNSKLVFKISMALYSCNTTGRFFYIAPTFQKLAKNRV